MKKLFLILFAILFLLPFSVKAENLTFPITIDSLDDFPTVPMTYNGITYTDYLMWDTGGARKCAYVNPTVGEKAYFNPVNFVNIAFDKYLYLWAESGNNFILNAPTQILLSSGATAEDIRNNIDWSSSLPIYDSTKTTIVYSPEGYELGDLWNVTDFSWQYGLSSNLYDITADHSTYYNGKLLYTFPVDYPHPNIEFHIKYPVTPQLLTMKIYDNDGIYYSYIDLDTDQETQQGGYPEQFYDFGTHILQFRDFELPVTENVLEKYTLVLTEQGSATPLVAREIYVGTSSQLPDDFFLSDVTNNQEEVNSFCDSFPHTMSGSMIGFAYDFDFHTDDMCKLIIPPNNYFKNEFGSLYQYTMTRFNFISQTSALLSTAQVAFATTPGAPTMPSITVMGHTYSTFNFAVGASGFDFLRHLTAAAMWILTALVAFVELKSYFRGSGEEELI